MTVDELIPSGIRNEHNEELYCRPNEFGHPNKYYTFVNRNGEWVRTHYPLEVDQLTPSGIKNEKGEEFHLNLDPFGQPDPKNAYVIRNGKWIRARYPVASTRIVETSSTNPYKGVWDSRNDHFERELSRVGSAFVPTHLEMAQRHITKSRYLLKKARGLGVGSASREEFKNALFYRNLAEKELDQHRRALRLSR